MQLTQFTDYALRALMYLAVKNDIATIAEIAKVYNISENHLVKIVNKLSQIDILKTTRGKNGGVQLAHAPEKINLKSLIEQLEPNFHFVECFNAEKANCCIIPACKLKHILEQARTDFLSTLDQYTLADITTNKQELAVLYFPKD